MKQNVYINSCHNIVSMTGRDKREAGKPERGGSRSFIINNGSGHDPKVTELYTMPGGVTWKK